MTTKALIIEDDPLIAEDVGDILTSLGHTYDYADCLETARARLAAERYAYYLVDLEIPVRTGRGLPRIQNGENLLEEIAQRFAGRKPPVIVITAHGRDGPDLAVEVMKKGALDFITKPFPTTGNTLDKKITEVLARSRPPSPLRQSAPEHVGEPTPFLGGDLVFFAERVELCGIKVCGGPRNGQIRKVLDILRQKNASGKYPAYSGTELADEIGAHGGQNGIAGCIRNFRTNVTRVLREEASMLCGPHDVIQSGGAGYRLAEWITVRNGEPGSAGSSPAGQTPGNVHDARTDNGDLGHDLDHEQDHDLDHAAPGERRRAWIIARLRAGQQLRVPAIARGLKCSAATAKRELEVLKSQGRIEFVGSARTGFYRLKA